MKTFIYDIVNQKRDGKIRDGWCIFEGQPCILPEGFVELEIVVKDQPPYDDKTQTLDEVRYADIPNKKWYIDWNIRNFTDEEIEERKPKWDNCTPRQFRLALLSKNSNPNYVDDLINSIENEEQRVRAKIEWEYALIIQKDHYLVQQLSSNLNMNSEELNQFFGYANSL